MLLKTITIELEKDAVQFEASPALSAGERTPSGDEHRSVLLHFGSFRSNNAEVCRIDSGLLINRIHPVRERAV